MIITTNNRSRLIIGIAIPALIFLSCTMISFSTKFKEHPDRFSIAMMLDMLLIAPLAYFFVIRKTTVSKFTVLRVFMLGILLAGIILSKNNSAVLAIIKTWISPLLEITLIGFIVWKFYIAKNKLSKTDTGSFDFLIYCRAILGSVFGSKKFANIMSSEIAVFYYAFSSKEKHTDTVLSFTSYKENGIVLILYTFLCLFIIETVGMHFVFQLWNKIAAWILTGLSFYTCMQLFAHTRALKIRSTIITANELIIRHGLMGGDVIVPLGNIENIVETNRQVPGTEVVKIAFINGLEKHNLAVYLKEPVTVIKAFGIQKTARIILLSIDSHKDFLGSIETAKKK